MSVDELTSQDHELLLELSDWIEVCEPREFITIKPEVWADLVQAGFVELLPTSEISANSCFVRLTRAGKRHVTKLRTSEAA